MGRGVVIHYLLRAKGIGDNRGVCFKGTIDQESNNTVR